MEKERCNEANCPCKKVDCVNHGRCCDCIMNHRKKGTLVSCMRMMLEEQEGNKQLKVNYEIKKRLPKYKRTDVTAFYENKSIVEAQASFNITNTKETVNVN